MVVVVVGVGGGVFSIQVQTDFAPNSVGHIKSPAFRPSDQNQACSNFISLQPTTTRSETTKTHKPQSTRRSTSYRSSAEL